MRTITLDNEAHDLTADVLQAIADRYETLRPTYPTGETDDAGGFIYDGRRTSTDSVVFTFGRKAGGQLQSHNIDGITAERVKAGEFDHVIRDSFDDRAGAEYWYRYCKDYGVDDG